jgi:hypothetical protein
VQFIVMLKLMLSISQAPFRILGGKLWNSGKGFFQLAKEGLGDISMSVGIT